MNGVECMYYCVCRTCVNRDKSCGCSFCEKTGIFPYYRCTCIPNGNMIQLVSKVEYNGKTYPKATKGKYILPIKGSTVWHRVNIGGKEVRVQEWEFEVLADQLSLFEGR